MCYTVSFMSKNLSNDVPKPTLGYDTKDGNFGRTLVRVHCKFSGGQNFYNKKSPLSVTA